jgi:hypothetical protein
MLGDDFSGTVFLPNNAVSGAGGVACCTKAAGMLAAAGGPPPLPLQERQRARRYSGRQQRRVSASARIILKTAVSRLRPRTPHVP